MKKIFKSKDFKIICIAIIAMILFMFLLFNLIELVDYTINVKIISFIANALIILFGIAIFFIGPLLLIYFFTTIVYDMSKHQKFKTVFINAIKKLAIIVGVILFIFLIVLSIPDTISTRVEMTLNWHVSLPSLKKSEELYSNFFRDGEIFSIVEFRSDRNINRFVKSNKLKPIKKSNINQIDNAISPLPSDSVDIYNKYIKKGLYETLNSKGNYYLIKNKKSDERDTLVLVFNTKERKLYIFEFFY